MFTLRTAAFAALTIFVAPFAMGGAPLFPRRLHLVRSVEQSLTGSPATIDEYCEGDTVVSVRGARVSILDYARRTLTEIDHDARTYSISGFEELAAAREATARLRPRETSAQRAWRPIGTGASASRAGETVDLAPEGLPIRLTVTIDRSVALSREALEILLGAAYPGLRDPQLDAVIAAAAPPPSRAAVLAAGAPAYGLPSAQTLLYEGNTVLTNSILRVDDAVVPPSLLAIDPGARRIESAALRLAREAAEIDRLPSQGDRR